MLKLTDKERQNWGLSPICLTSTPMFLSMTLGGLVNEKEYKSSDCLLDYLENSGPHLTFYLRFSGFSKVNSCICSLVTFRSMSKFHILLKSIIKRKISKGKGEEGGICACLFQSCNFFFPMLLFWL